MSMKAIAWSLSQLARVRVTVLEHARRAGSQSTTYEMFGEYTSDSSISEQLLRMSRGALAYGQANVDVMLVFLDALLVSPDILPVSWAPDA
jgi:hypothetical protein